jgi:hypothetical protein
MLCTQTGIALIYAFTWQVFRPAETWGKAVVATGAALMLTSLLLATWLLAHAPAEASSPVVTRNAMLIGMLGYCGCFLWSSIEGLVHHRNARKRMALGLADAVVANRFLLWAIFGLTASGVNAASVAGTLLGVDPSRSPLVLIPLGFLGFAASVAMYLAFLPPAAYLAFVRRRAASQA